MINFEQFGSRRIFRPAPEVEAWIREAAEKHLRSRFEPGDYQGRDRANEVIKHQFQFYEKLLNNALPNLLERGSVEFLLSQFDEASELLHGNGILDLAERERWLRIEPFFKRGIKYLVERICLMSAHSWVPVSPRQSMLAVNVAVVCAEVLSHMAQESDLVFSIFPEHGTASVAKPGQNALFHIHVTGKHSEYAERFSARLRRDRQHRDKRVAWPPFAHHTETHQRYLDSVFQSEFGMTYGHFIHVVTQTIANRHPSLEPGSFETLFISRARLVAGLVEVSGQPQAAIERALDGFTIRPENLKQEQRAITKPKQTHRAFRRGFFLMPHEEGPHLCFSRAMARENLINMCGAVAFQKLPPEWTTKATSRALSDLSRAAGQWFEQVLTKRLHEMGITGGGVTRRFGFGLDALDVPPEVGQIDFLGFTKDEGLIVVIEAKMVSGALEPAIWRDELHDFLGEKKYADRFRRKIRWVERNRTEIARAFGIDREAKVVAALVTYYPSIVAEFIDDFPCVSLAELILDFEKCRGWPYPPVSLA